MVGAGTHRGELAPWQRLGQFWECCLEAEREGRERETLASPSLSFGSPASLSHSVNLTGSHWPGSLGNVVGISFLLHSTEQEMGWEAKRQRTSSCARKGIADRSG